MVRSAANREQPDRVGARLPQVRRAWLAVFFASASRANSLQPRPGSRPHAIAHAEFAGRVGAVAFGAEAGELFLAGRAAGAQAAGGVDDAVPWNPRAFGELAEGAGDLAVAAGEAGFFGDAAVGRDATVRDLIDRRQDAHAAVVGGFGVGAGHGAGWRPGFVALALTRSVLSNSATSVKHLAITIENSTLAAATRRPPSKTRRRPSGSRGRVPCGAGCRRTSGASGPTRGRAPGARGPTRGARAW